MKKLGIAFLFAPIACIVSCTVMVYDTSRLLNDFQTEGFLDRDHFQVTVKGFPDMKTRGLVEKRDSALNDAEAKIEETVLKKLADYYFLYAMKKYHIKSQKEILNFDDAQIELQNKLRAFLPYTHRAFEYFNEDYSAVIVLRIYKKNLLENLESINIKIVRIEDIISEETKKQSRK